MGWFHRIIESNIAMMEADVPLTKNKKTTTFEANSLMETCPIFSAELFTSQRFILKTKAKGTKIVFTFIAFVYCIYRSPL